MNEATSTAVVAAAITGDTYRSTLALDARRAQAPVGAEDRARVGVAPADGEVDVELAQRLLLSIDAATTVEPRRRAIATAPHAARGA